MTYKASERERPWITTAEASELLEQLGLPVSVRTLERMRATGDGPPYQRVTRQIRYHRGRLAEWVASCEAGTPARKRGTPARAGGTRGR